MTAPYARNAVSMSAMYSSALAITSISAQGRRCESVFDSASSEIDGPPRTSAVVVTRVTLQASPKIEAATSKQKMETCAFGADDQKLTGAARKKFMANCMANRDSPRGKPAPRPQ